MVDADKRKALEEAAEWYFLRDAGPFSGAEERAFDAWLADPRHRAAYEKLDTTWDRLGAIPRPSVPSEETPHIAVPAVRSLAPRVFAVAAAIAIAFGLGQALDLPMRLQADARTETGEIATIPLADGSEAMLNTGSAIAVDYSGQERRIRLLRGEAVFTVARDPERPFIVEAAGGETRALGTIFAVRDEEAVAIVTVLESRVAVSSPVPGASAILSANEAVAYNDTGLDAKEQVDAESETAWRRGRLVFVDRRLGQVIDELNRYHSGRIQITDETIRDHLVSGVFELADPVKIVDALEGSLGLHSTRLTNYLILLHR